MSRYLIAAALLLASCDRSPVGDEERAFVASCTGGTQSFAASYIVREGDCVRFYNRFGNGIDTACGCGRVVEVQR